MQLRPDADGVAALERAVPVSLRLTLEDGETVDTWPVWPYQQAALRLLLAGRRDPKILAATGSLGVADDEVAALLDELDAALMIDGTSLWRVAKRPTATSPSSDGSDGPRTAYEELDWERLRQHPKLAQYHTASTRDSRLEPTDLQVILTAITDHFRGLGTDRDPRRTKPQTQSQEHLHPRVRKTASRNVSGAGSRLPPATGWHGAALSIGSWMAWPTTGLSRLSGRSSLPPTPSSSTTSSPC